jgi:hypothetical protein
VNIATSNFLILLSLYFSTQHLIGKLIELLLCTNYFVCEEVFGISNGFRLQRELGSETFGKRGERKEQRISAKFGLHFDGQQEIGDRNENVR